MTEAPWWGSGVLTLGAALAGASFAYLFNMLQAKREHQFKREEAELERRSRREDEWQQLYARFMKLCYRVVAKKTDSDKDEFHDCLAEIGVHSVTTELAQGAEVLSLRILALIDERPKPDGKEF